jgi:cytochrome c oxidase subunit 1
MHFEWNFPHNMQKIMHIWLRVSILSLAIAGLLSLILVLARTPFLQNYLPYKDFFYSALVVHVNLSVLIWLMSISAMMWSSITNEKYYIIAKTASVLGFIGMVLIAISPFFSESKALLNNYIPVLVNLIFYLGLALFATALI